MTPFHLISKKERINTSLYFKEYDYVLYGIIKALNGYKKRLYRFALFYYKRNLEKELVKTILSKQYISQKLIKCFGDYSHYKNYTNDTLKETILNSADKILTREFNLLGGNVVFANKIDWHTDFKSGFTWKKGTFYLNYNQVDLSNNADVKIPRELSRSHHLLILGQAYLLTGDEKYTEEFTSQITDWIDENPLMYSINWGCTMDVAIRASNWVIALNMFIKSDTIDQSFLEIILKSLYEHGWFIENNLEKGFMFRANHYDGDLGGLLTLGILFSDLKRGDHWLNYSKFAIYSEIRCQVLPSGMQWEKSTFYNRLVLEIFSYSIFLLKRNKHSIPGDIEFRIWKMFQFINEITFPDGQLPILGDQDNARFLPFDTIYRNDIDYLKNIAANYFKDLSFSQNINNQISSEVFFLIQAGDDLSFTVVPKITREKIYQSKPFTDVGINKLANDNFFILINNSSPGRYVDNIFAVGSHAHADLLSFVLAYKGIQIFIDPGTGVYTSDYKIRNKFRATNMHNTITFDNNSQFKISSKKLFSFDSYSEVKNLEFTNVKNTSLYHGLNEVNINPKNIIIHSRRFILDGNNNTFLIRDYVSASEKHYGEINFILHPDLFAKSYSDFVTISKNNISIAELKINSVNYYQVKTEKTSYSPSYGKILDCNKITIYFELEKFIDIEFMFLPFF